MMMGSVTEEGVEVQHMQLIRVCVYRCNSCIQICMALQICKACTVSTNPTCLTLPNRIIHSLKYIKSHGVIT